MAEIFWHNLETEKIAEILRTDTKKGLGKKEVVLRKEEFGENKLPEEKPLPRFRIFLEQFRSPLIYILVIAGIITLFLEKFADTIVIFSAVFLNTIVGYFQENKASQTLRKLKKAVRHEAEVLRQGNLKIIDSTALVPGDIVILNPGDKVPADGRIIECQELKINEMALTGEWISARKNPNVLPEDTPLADRDNMVYMGTVVEAGRGKVIITDIGGQTEIGRVATMVREAKEEKTPYQKKLANFSRIVGLIIGLVCLGIFVEGMVTGGDFVEMFTTAVAVAVAAVPEGLPVAMTVILALGMQRILRKRGLVRKLASAETLGSTSVICSDKTATLTEGKMKVAEVIGDKFLSLKAAVLTSEAFIENPEDEKEKWILRGRPTDKALLEAGIEVGIDGKKELEKKKIAEIPFNPINKFAAALYEENNEKILYVCGAPEKILQLSNLTKKEEEKWQGKLEELAQKGLRVVASAFQKLSTFPTIVENVDIKEICRDLTFVGFITLKDPIRKEVKGAMKNCRRAGIRIIIITGDHKLTAKAVAEELGFNINEENILEGRELDNLSDQELDKILTKIQIYARVEPKHKLRIVRAWQDKGEVVAMTGDGINDAPALKRADIGVALGSGTEVAKETSDLILLNNSFSIIVAAIEEGRAIIDNIRKVITYLLSDSFTEVILIGVTMFIFRVTGQPWTLPVTAVQILWVNLIEDGLPNIALSFEPKEKDVMQKKPGGHSLPLLTREMKVIIFVIGILTDLILLGLFFWLWDQTHNTAYVRTIVFAALGIDSIFYVFSCKSLRRNLWHINPFSNKPLILAWAISVVFLLIALYLPIAQVLLKTIPLGFSDWLILIGLGMTEVVFIEAAKWYFISRHQTDQ